VSPALRAGTAVRRSREPELSNQVVSNHSLARIYQCYFLRLLV
jgi:hypothetical protein